MPLTWAQFPPLLPGNGCAPLGPWSLSLGSCVSPPGSSVVSLSLVPSLSLGPWQWPPLVTQQSPVAPGSGPLVVSGPWVPEFAHVVPGHGPPGPPGPW